MGEKVEGKYKGGKRWFPGKVTRVNEDRRGDVTSYDLRYEDGDSEQDVPVENVRSIGGRDEEDLDGRGGRSSSPSKRKKTFERHDKVEARYKNGSRWYTGKVSRVNLDRRDEIESYDIDYDDGEFERNVVPENIRAFDHDPVCVNSVPIIMSKGFRSDLKVLSTSLRKCISKASTFRIFSRFDSREKGVLGRGDFKACLEELVEVSRSRNTYADIFPRAEEDTMLLCLREDDRETFKYGAFVSYICQLGAQDDKENVLIELLPKLKIAVTKKNVKSDNLIESFRKLDKKDSGLLGSDDFEGVVSKLTTKIKSNELKALSEYFGFEGGRELSVDYLLFTEWLFADSNMPNLLENWRFQASLLEPRVLDRNLDRVVGRKDKLSMDGFIEAMTEGCGMLLTSFELRSIFDELDGENKGRLKVEDVVHQSKKRAKGTGGRNSRRSGRDRDGESDDGGKSGGEEEKGSDVGSTQLLTGAFVKDLKRQLRSFMKSTDISLYKVIANADDSTEKQDHKFTSKSFRALLRTLDIDLSEGKERLLFDSLKTGIFS